MAGALLFFLAASAVGQEPLPVEITLSGGVSMTGVSRDRTLNEAALWTPGGLPAGSPLRGHDSFVLPEIALRFDVALSSVRAAVEIGNAVLHDDSGDPRLQEDRLGEATALRFRLLQAWLEIVDGLRLGQQEFIWDPGGRGRPLYLAPSRSESPWLELPDSTVPPFPPSGTRTVPETRRDRLFPVGASARLDELTLFAFLLAEGGPPSGDEGLYGATWSGTFDAFRLGTVATLMSGGGHRQAVGTGGLAVGLDLSPFSVSLEGYGQYGRAGEHLRASGNAARGVVRWSDGPWIEGTFVRVSGDRRGDDDHEGRFLSYEDNDATLIVEGDEYGLDVDSNYWSVQVSAGVTFEILDKPVRPKVTVAGFRFLEAVPLSPDPLPGISGRSRLLGTEIDFSLELEWTTHLTFAFATAVLFQARAIEEFTQSREDRAVLFTLGLRSAF